MFVKIIVLYKIAIIKYYDRDLSNITIILTLALDKCKTVHVGVNVEVFYWKWNTYKLMLCAIALTGIINNKC